MDEIVVVDDRLDRRQRRPRARNFGPRVRCVRRGTPVSRRRATPPVRERAATSSPSSTPTTSGRAAGSLSCSPRSKRIPTAASRRDACSAWCRTGGRRVEARRQSWRAPNVSTALIRRDVFARRSVRRRSRAPTTSTGCYARRRARRAQAQVDAVTLLYRRHDGNMMRRRRGPAAAAPCSVARSRLVARRLRGRGLRATRAAARERQVVRARAACARTFEAPCAGERTLDVAGVRLRVGCRRRVSRTARCVRSRRTAVADDPAVPPDVTLLVLDHDVPGNPDARAAAGRSRTPPVGTASSAGHYDGDAGRGLLPEGFRALFLPQPVARAMWLGEGGALPYHVVALPLLPILSWPSPSAAARWYRPPS